MEEALIAKLLACVPITSLVSSRIYWQVRKQGEATYPVIVLQKISSVPSLTNDGPSKLLESRVQVDCWGKDYASALATSRAVNTFLSGARFWQGSVEFQGCFLLNERHSFEEPSADAAERLHRVSIDYTIWHAT